MKRKSKILAIVLSFAFFVVFTGSASANEGNVEQRIETKNKENVNMLANYMDIIKANFVKSIVGKEKEVGTLRYEYRDHANYDLHKDIEHEVRYCMHFYAIMSKFLQKNSFSPRYLDFLNMRFIPDPDIDGLKSDVRYVFVISPKNLNEKRKWDKSLKDESPGKMKVTEKEYNGYKDRLLKYLVNKQKFEKEQIEIIEKFIKTSDVDLIVGSATVWYYYFELLSTYGLLKIKNSDESKMYLKMSDVLEICTVLLKRLNSGKKEFKREELEKEKIFGVLKAEEECEKLNKKKIFIEDFLKGEYAKTSKKDYIKNMLEYYKLTFETLKSKLKKPGEIIDKVKKIKYDSKEFTVLSSQFKIIDLKYKGVDRDIEKYKNEKIKNYEVDKRDKINKSANEISKTAEKILT